MGSQAPGKWGLHPEVVAEIWCRFVTAVADMFASGESTHCSLFFSLGRDNPTLSTDAMSHQWPQGLLYAFPPFDFFLPLLQRIRIEEVRLVLIPPKWPHMVWLSDIPPLICGAPWELPVSKDLLSQAHRVLFHNSPQGPNQAFLPKILSDSQFNQRLELYP